MVLVGLGILFASLTFLVLRSPCFKWREAIDSWSGKYRDADRVSAERENGDGDGGSEGNIDLKQTPNAEKESTASNEEAREGGAETLKPPSPATISRSLGVQRSTPTITLDKTSRTFANRTGLPAGQQVTPTALRNQSATPKQIATISTRDGRSHTSSTTMRSPQPNSKSAQSASLLMPPPPPRPSALRPLPKLNNSSSLAPPQSLASTLRAPPRSSSTLLPALAATTSTLPPASRPSRKVILPPGHSPLDWAALTTSPPTASYLRGAALPAHLIRVPPSLLKRQNGRKGHDAWGTWQGKVYNLTPYRKFHPGGEGELMRGAGKAGEAERLFMEVHPWVNWEGMLGECLVGLLVSEEEAEGGGDGEGVLEEMD